jgi:hypothetical protein
MGLRKHRRPGNEQRNNTELDLKNRMGIEFHKFSGLSILILKLLGSHEALCFIKLVISWYVLTNTIRREEQLLHPAVLG